MSIERGIKHAHSWNKAPIWKDSVQWRKRKDVVATIVTTEELTLDDIKIIAHYGQKVIGGPRAKTFDQVLKESTSKMKAPTSTAIKNMNLLSKLVTFSYQVV